MFTPPNPMALLALQEYRAALAAFKAEHSAPGAMADAILEFAIRTRYGGKHSNKERKVFAAIMRPHRPLSSKLANHLLTELIEAIDVYTGNIDGIAPDRVTLQSFRIATALGVVNDQQAAKNVPADFDRDLLSACNAVTAVQHLGCDVANELYISTFRRDMRAIAVHGETLSIISNETYPAANGIVLVVSKSSSAFHNITDKLLGVGDEARLARENELAPGLIVTSSDMLDVLLKRFEVKGTKGPTN